MSVRQQDVNVESQPEKHAAGRKPKGESRAMELRQKLVFWQQTPESLRPSLRALARQNNTSHQLLTFYLEGLKEWQYKERYRNAKQGAQQNAEENRRRAAVEGREMTTKEYLDALFSVGWIEQVESLRQAAKRGPLNWYQGQMLKPFARSQVVGAEELLRQCLQVGLLKRKSFAEIVRATSRREGEPLNVWVRRIWSECEKYGTACPTVITEELLVKYSRGKSEDSEGKFATSAAKSFRCDEGMLETSLRRRREASAIT